VRLLLDTHALIWWLLGDPALSRNAVAGIADDDNGVFISAVSAWEISAKYRIGKLPAAAMFAADVAGAAASQGFDELPINLQHGQLAGSLPGPHRDPFDRMLAAQALLAGLVLVSNETVFDRYGVRRLW
jgi:PIN domain nuclease of toxin-antitoxin system